jgi:RNA polymerase sigma-70 factor, ECF subfamily
MRARRDFERLALPHLAAVYRLARQFAGEDRADDLVQETYLRAWSRFHQFDPASNCRAWLCRILHNVWVSNWRKTRLELPVADVEDVRAEPQYDWESEISREELSQDLQWALDQLPDAFRWAVLLADVEELTYQEISAAMSCPVGTVMSRLNRGRQMLARLLEGRRGAAAAALVRPIRVK